MNAELQGALEAVQRRVDSAQAAGKDVAVVRVSDLATLAAWAKHADHYRDMAEQTSRNLACFEEEQKRRAEQEKPRGLDPEAVDAAIAQVADWVEKAETWDTAFDGLDRPDIVDAILCRISDAIAALSLESSDT